MDDHVRGFDNGGRGGARECAKGVCGLIWLCTHRGPWDGIETTSFAPHPNPPIVYLLLPVLCRPLTRSMAFIDVFFKFPHPPISTPSSLHPCPSYTTSISSADSGPFLWFRTLPRAPSMSDDELSLPSPQFNPCRAAIKTLIIAKHNSSPRAPVQRQRAPISASLLQPFKNSIKRPNPLSPHPYV